MKKYLASMAILAVIAISCSKETDLRFVEQGMIDHNTTDLSAIPSEWLTKARSDLHIAYGHTSHGSQVTDGMTGLVSFSGSEYAWNNGGTGGALDLHDYAMPGDLGNPNYTQWATETRSYLSVNPDVNVIMWSWCGQLSSG